MRSLLVPFYNDDNAQSTLRQALTIARRFDAHIEGVFLAPSPQIIDAGGIGIPTASSIYLTEVEREGSLQAEQAKARFEEVIAQQTDSDTISASWSELGGTIGGIGEYGRIFDMIVIGRGFAQTWIDWNVICESALFECGRPVLITDSETNSTTEHAVIAWNRSTETARTVALAMPILHKTQQVTVFTVDGWATTGPSGEALAGNLLHHGISARLININPAGKSPGQAIVDEAINTGADLLIKGAYTQSRFRQFVFGGATRYILQNCSTLPVLMAH